VTTRVNVPVCLLLSTITSGFSGKKKELAILTNGVRTALTTDCLSAFQFPVAFEKALCEVSIHRILGHHPSCQSDRFHFDRTLSR
jgi:hypothetical protein